MTKIIRMLRIGSRWRVHLECGHSFTVDAAESLHGQLYIGKRHSCEDCQ